MVSAIEGNRIVVRDTARLSFSTHVEGRERGSTVVATIATRVSNETASRIRLTT
jgi:hypothetical protein